jgi:hypothetical protein
LLSDTLIEGDACVYIRMKQQNWHGMEFRRSIIYNETNEFDEHEINPLVPEINDIVVEETIFSKSTGHPSTTFKGIEGWNLKSDS